MDLASTVSAVSRTKAKELLLQRRQSLQIGETDTVTEIDELLKEIRDENLSESES
jgi:hypothetical protein